MADFIAIKDELVARMRRAAPDMLTLKEGPEGITLEADWPNPLHPKQRMWFGGVKAGKAYVSYHLMPVYSHPTLLDGISPELRKRMQGKSCFNFKAVDPALFDELEQLTRDCAALYANPF